MTIIAQLEAATEGGRELDERAMLEAYAREMSIMLCNVLGGGSEWFKRIGDEFYVCPKIAGAELQRRKTDAQITKKALIRANRKGQTHA